MRSVLAVILIKLLNRGRHRSFADHTVDASFRPLSEHRSAYAIRPRVAGEARSRRLNWDRDPRPPPEG